ncbi:transcription elongation factor GreA [Caldalkalibacillus thermarum TA2.A1]|uniref:Transcription elongation factor GreA n=1 Tax=Caldalkalibacillus thermarum (strain TA2.A1) TaxID=986075 RepID=F5L569_CALTT|nr:transcription elongation factor GreA [Caldalkalibacillus thermarum]EGL83499.1 transcription elongation factor GreA [Caldalkalibacillus thermarum TA2.A1]QZT33456.1 transcription elongation factor GreA [Caldalkalibacillus thermarum TA2.A1]
MADKETLVTEEGLKKLKDELEYLITVKRPEVVEKIKIARSYGDLSENSEYDAARDEQAFVESRIQQLQKMILNAKIIDASKEEEDVVTVGKTVVFQELPDGETEEYTIVGRTEADPAAGKISNDSPMAKGLLGRKAGEVVTIHTPGGDIEVKILEVRV